MKKIKKIVCFYFNYGKKCGYGHLSRCSVLNNLLKKSGINSHFLKIKNLDISYLKNFKLIAIKELKKINLKKILIIDDYNVSSKEIKKLKKYFNYIILIDDLITKRTGINTIVNPNFSVRKQHYNQKSLDSFFLGPKFKLVNYSKKKIFSNPKEVTISFGGGAVFNQIKKVLNYCLTYFESKKYKGKINIFISLKNNQKSFFSRYKTLNLNVSKINKNFLDTVLKSKFCISSLGVQHDELVYLKIPSIFLKISPNQNLNFKYAKLINSKFVFDIDKFNKDIFYEALDNLDNKKKRLRIKKKYQKTKIGSNLNKLNNFILKQ